MKKLYLIVLLVLAGQYAFAGYTKGYYDRLLSSSKATKIGVGYDFQFLDEDIPAEEHDITMDIVITESRRLVIHHTRKPGS